MIMEKRYFINGSGSKWISVGIVPETKILSPEGQGFHIEITIDGKNAAGFRLGGLDGILNLCKTLRAMEPLQFTYPGSAGNYSEIANDVPLNIMSKPFNGGTLFTIENMNNESIHLMSSSLGEMLKHEKYIIATAKFLQEKMVDDVEKKFNAFISKASSDLSGALIDAEKTSDLIIIEIITNFNELFRLCIDEIARNAQVVASATAATSTGQKRKRTPAAKPNKRKGAAGDAQKLPDDVAAVIEVIATDSNKSTTDEEEEEEEANIVPDNIGLIESGQRFDSDAINEFFK